MTASDKNFWDRAILHIDMDAFYAAVEQRDHPEFRGQPVIIGGGERSVVSTCSYEARKFGVHSAMPTSQAKRLCPRGIFLPVDMPRYRAASQQIFAVFSRWTPRLQPLSLDEAFLDCTGSQRLFGPAPTIAEQIHAEVKAETDLTCSIGVATTLFAAKIASDFRKPNGITIIPRERADEILGALAVNKIWGVGEVAFANLTKLGIRTIADLRTWDEDVLRAKFGEKFGRQLFLLARNIDDREIGLTPPPEKSFSRETTFPRDLWDVEIIEQHLRDLAESVGQRARAENRFGRCVFLKVRYADFSTITRQVKLFRATNSTAEIFSAAQKLWREKTSAGTRSVRLIGVGLSDLGDEPIADVSLFAEPPAEILRAEKIAQTEITADKIHRRFGKHSLTRGSKLLADEEGELITNYKLRTDVTCLPAGNISS